MGHRPDLMVRSGVKIKRKEGEENIMARHGENIRKRKDGRWEGRYLVYSRTKERKIYISVYGSTYKEVKEKMITRLAQREDPGPCLVSPDRNAEHTGIEQGKEHAEAGQEQRYAEAGQGRSFMGSGIEQALIGSKQRRDPTGSGQGRGLTASRQAQAPTGSGQGQGHKADRPDRPDRIGPGPRRSRAASSGLDPQEPAGPEQAVRQLSFVDMAEEWLTTVKATRKPSTYVKYSTICKHHLKKTFADMYITDIDDISVKARIDPALSASSQKSIYCVLNQILRSTSKKYLLALPDLKRDGDAARKKPVEILSRNEQKRLFPLLYCQTTPCKMAVLLCLHTGLRLGELCALKWEDIDLEDRLLTVNRTVQRLYVEGQQTKTILLETSPKSERSKREIPLSEEMMELLFRVCDDLSRDDKERYLFGGEKPLEPRTLQNHFKRFLKEAELPDKNFHILRHTFATNCIEGGTDVRSLSEILGHSDVQITLNRYVHPSMDTKRRYIEDLSVFYGRISGQPENGWAESMTKVKAGGMEQTEKSRRSVGK